MGKDAFGIWLLVDDLKVPGGVEIIFSCIVNDAIPAPLNGKNFVNLAVGQL